MKHGKMICRVRFGGDQSQSEAEFQRMRTHYFRPLSDVPNIDKIMMHLDWGPLTAAPTHMLSIDALTFKFQ